MRKYITLSILVLATLQGCFCLFEREKGQNEWKIESLGEIKDLKFIENSPHIYTLSTTGLLSLFDTERN